MQGAARTSRALSVLLALSAQFTYALLPSRLPSSYASNTVGAPPHHAATLKKWNSRPAGRGAVTGVPSSLAAASLSGSSDVANNGALARKLAGPYLGAFLFGKD